MVSLRVAARARADFGPQECNVVLGLLEQLNLPFLGDNPLGRERVHAAVLILADGDSSRFLQAAALAEADWRDLLLTTGLANEDWPERVETVLATP